MAAANVEANGDMKVEYPEISPRACASAHKDGRVALFVGAGASVASPSCLPDEP